MVEARAHHVARLLHLHLAELRVLQLARREVVVHVVLSVAPAERLLPHQDAVFVAEVEEAFALLVVRAADEVSAERLEALDVLQHERFARGRAVEPVGLVPVEALEEQLLAVQVYPAVLRLYLADTETHLAAGDFDRREVWLLGAPELEVGNRANFLLAALYLDLDLAGPVVERADEHLRLALDELHAVVESAVEVEVVVRTRQLHARPRKDVVDRGEDGVLARGERSDRNLKPRVWIRMKSQVLPVQRELRADAHSVHDENRVLHRLREREGAAVESGAALHVPLRHHVVARGDGNRIRCREVDLRGLLQRLALLEAEAPASVKRKRFGGHAARNAHPDEQQQGM